MKKQLLLGISMAMLFANVANAATIVAGGDSSSSTSVGTSNTSGVGYTVNNGVFMYEQGNGGEAGTTFEYDPNQTYYLRNVVDNWGVISYPCWIWVKEYRYYYENAGSYLKNTVTPDGYTVDSEGRWTVDGVAQSNGYGTRVMGTDVYAGKTDAELWAIQKNKLVDMVLDMYVDNPYQELDIFDGDDHLLSQEISGGCLVRCAGGAYGDLSDKYATFCISSWWDEVTDVSMIISAGSRVVNSTVANNAEKTLKIMLGDVEGQWVLDYLTPYADMLSEDGFIPAFKEDGTLCIGTEELVDTIVPADGGGIIVTSEIVFTENESISEELQACYDDLIMGNYDKTNYNILSNGAMFKTERGYAGDGFVLTEDVIVPLQNRTTDYGKTYTAFLNNGKLWIEIWN